MPEIGLTTSTTSGAISKPGRGRSRSRRALRVLAITLVLAGALALIDAGITLLWQEPISALYATLRQDSLSGELRTVERAAPTAQELRQLASLTDERRRIAFLAGELRRNASEGSPVGRIVIPSIGASFVLVKGTGVEALMSGPGIYRETSFPSISGTTAIAGHRTTYLAPFRHIDSLTPGSQIMVEMPYAHFSYTVIGQRVVEPTDVPAAVSEVGYSRVVLSACTPVFSAAKRLLVYARLTRVVPEGAARALPGGSPALPIESGPGFAAPARPIAHRPLPAMLKSLDPHRLTSLV